MTSSGASDCMSLWWLTLEVLPENIDYGFFALCMTASTLTAIVRSSLSGVMAPGVGFASTGSESSSC